MSAAPSWPLISSPVRANLPRRDGHPPRVEFRSVFLIWKPVPRIKILSRSTRPSKRKTTREAHDCTRPSQPSFHGLQKPEIACLPTACPETLPFPPPTVLSCCHPHMGWQR